VVVIRTLERHAFPMLSATTGFIATAKKLASRVTAAPAPPSGAAAGPIAT
jgi:hypothetical protein